MSSEERLLPRDADVALGLPRAEAALPDPLDGDVTRIFDRAHTEAERAGQILDAHLISALKGYQVWRNRTQWVDETSDPDLIFDLGVSYRVSTTTADGAPRTLVATEAGGLIEEYEGDRLLGRLQVYSPSDHTPSIYGTQIVGYDSATDPQFNSHRYGAGDGNYISIGAAVVGHTSTGYGIFPSSIGAPRRERYVAPGMGSLPHPIDQHRRFTDMLSRGEITHRRVSRDGTWNPIAPQGPGTTARR